MTNQECTCRAVLTLNKDGQIIGEVDRGPCHSPGPEVWEALGQWLAYIHSQAAATDGRYGSKGRRLREIERTAAEFMEHLENGTLGDDYYRYADTLRQERDTLLARNEELEQAALRLGNCVDLYLQGAVDQVALRQGLISFQRTLINGEETTIEQPTVEDEGRSCCSENPGANVGCCPDRVANPNVHKACQQRITDLEAQIAAWRKHCDDIAQEADERNGQLEGELDTLLARNEELVQALREMVEHFSSSVAAVPNQYGGLLVAKARTLINGEEK